MKTALSLMLASLVIVSTQAAAQPVRRPHDPGVNTRQHRQDVRVRQGVQSGQLTKDERKDLHQDVNSLSQDIYNEKHDGDARPKAQQQ